jgi:hypothetical protein
MRREVVAQGDIQDAAFREGQLPTGQGQPAIADVSRRGGARWRERKGTWNRRWRVKAADASWSWWMCPCVGVDQGVSIARWVLFFGLAFLTVEGSMQQKGA